MFESDAMAELATVMVHAAGETLAGLATFDPAVLDDTTVRTTVRELEMVRRRLDAASCHFLAELHDRKGTETDAALATSRWLAREANLPASAATQRLKTATKLYDVLPDVDLALREGRIGFDHARVLAQVTNDRNADAMATASAALCDLAGLMAFGPWRREVHAAAAYAAPDGGEPDPTREQLHLSGTDGLLLFRGELTGDEAITFEHAINAKADELFHQYKREQELFPDAQIPGRAALRARALVELCRQAQGIDLETTKGPSPDATIIFHTQPAPADPATPTELDLGPILGTGPTHGGTCCGHRPVVTTPDGTRLDDNTAALLACSAVFRGLWVDANGVPIAETDAYRPSRSIRRALRHRDGGCTFPGCGARFEWTEAHHLEHWPTGPTALRNLVSLCRRHHRAVHRYGWTVTLGDDGWTRWTSPGGTTRWGQRHFKIRAGP